MRVWLYARLSNDDDREMNSLLNQREICQVFAEQHGYTIVGQSFDDNISGMVLTAVGWTSSRRLWTLIKLTLSS